MYPTTERGRLAAAAGVATTAVLLAVVFVGPWRLLGVRPGPAVAVVATHYWRTTLVASVATLLVGVAVGAIYPHYADPDGDGWAELVRGIVYAPAAVVVAAAALSVLASTLRQAAAGDVATAAASGILALLVAVTLGPAVAMVAAGLFVTAAVVGVYAGVRVGRRTTASRDAGPRLVDVMDRDADTAADGPAADGAPVAAGRLRRTLARAGAVDREAPEFVGAVAGAVATALVAVPLTVGPWAVVALDPTAGTPVSPAPGGSGPALAVGALLSVGVGYAAAARYRRSVDGPAAGFRRRMAWQAVVVPMLLGMAVTVLVLVGNAVAGALAAGTSPALAVVAAAFTGLLVGSAGGVVAAVVVGVPTAVGVLLGGAERVVPAAV